MTIKAELKMKNYYRNVLELGKTKYFHLNQEGELELNPDIVSRIVDCHLHLGLSYFFGKPVDLLSPITDSELLFPVTSLPVNLKLHTSANYTPQLRRKLHLEARRSMFGSKGINQHITVPRLLHELNLMHVKKAFVLAIDYPFFSNNSTNLLSVVDNSHQLLGFVSLHPLSRNKSAKIVEYKKAGATGIKLHPTFMGLRPRHRSYFEIYDTCQQLGLPILFHTGYGSLVPKWSQYLVSPSDFDYICQQFPKLKVIFGHGGGQCLFEEMAEVSNKHSQTFLQYDGLPAEMLKKVLKKIDTDRALIGSDWPVFPMSLQYIRGFIATEKNQELRNKLFYRNAELLLANLD